MPLFRRTPVSSTPDAASAAPEPAIAPLELPSGPPASPPLSAAPRVSYLPAANAHWSIPQTIAAADQWLETCSGEWTVVAPATTGVVDTRLQALTRHHRVIPAQALLREPPRPGGILVAWPDAEILGIISSGSGVVTADHRLCVLEWGQGSRQSAWLRAHHGVDARHGIPYPRSRARLIPFVVESQLAELDSVLRGGHSQDAQLEVAGAFALLQREGHGCDPDGLWAWALERGHPPDRAELLRQKAAEMLVSIDALPRRPRKKKNTTTEAQLNQA